jgi:pimeloyl-ACP methyl ester carboxylesterase
MMTQVVFVHGVGSSREPTAYAADIKTRNERFRNAAFVGGEVEFYNPFWGDLGASFAWNEASLPTKGNRAASFSLLDQQDQVSSNAPMLAEIASNNFGAAIDALYTILVEKAEEDNRRIGDDEYREFLAAATYAEENLTPDWIRPDMSDDEFIEHLRRVLGTSQPASYGLIDKLAEAASAVVDRGRNLVSNGLVGLFRDNLNPRVAYFIGDVFVYLRENEPRRAIRARVAEALVQAHENAITGNGPLVVIGHSMGGVILYDMLTDPQGADLPQNFKVNVLMTVGSQPGLFEEMKLFAASNRDIGASKPRKRAPKPAGTACWWNVYDPVDLLAFRCEDIFDEVEDFVFDSVTGLVDAHTTYFKRPRFHARLRARLSVLP